MIKVAVSPTALVVDRKATLVFRLANQGWSPCYSIACRFDLPVSILRLRGLARMPVVECLKPGESWEHRLDVRPTKVGFCFVELSNLSWRDRRDDSQRAGLVRLMLNVVEAPFTAERRQAQAHQQAGRWRAAWPLYWQAGELALAATCHERAVDGLEAKRQYGEAACECRDWAEAQIRRLGQRAVCDPVIAGWLQRASELFTLASDDTNSAMCRDRLYQLMELPILDFALIPPVGVPFTVGRSTLVTVRVTNVGYGQARNLKLKLAGDLVREDEHEPAMLNPGQTLEWSDASVVPKFASTCIVSVEAEFVATCTGKTEHKASRYKIVADPVDVLERLQESGLTTVQFNIGKYAAPGAVISETSISDSILVRSSVSSHQIEEGRAQDAEGKAKITCPACGELITPAPYCTQCGNALGLR